MKNFAFLMVLTTLVFCKKQSDYSVRFIDNTVLNIHLIDKYFSIQNYFGESDFNQDTKNISIEREEQAYKKYFKEGYIHHYTIYRSVKNNLIYYTVPIYSSLETVASIDEVKFDRVEGLTDKGDNFLFLKFYKSHNAINNYNDYNLKLQKLLGKPITKNYKNLKIYKWRKKDFSYVAYNDNENSKYIFFLISNKLYERFNAKDVKFAEEIF